MMSTTPLSDDNATAAATTMEDVNSHSNDHHHAATATTRSGTDDDQNGSGNGGNDRGDDDFSPNHHHLDENDDADDDSSFFFLLALHTTATVFWHVCPIVLEFIISRVWPEDNSHKTDMAFASIHSFMHACLHNECGKVTRLMRSMQTQTLLTHHDRASFWTVLQ